MTTTMTETQSIPWADFRAEMLSLYGPRMRAKSTRWQMEFTFRMLESLGVKSTSDLTVPLIVKLVESRPAGQSPYTLKGILIRVQTICTYAETAGYLNRSPFRIRAVKQWVRTSRPAGKRHLSREEIHAILDRLAKDCEERQGWALWRSRRLRCLVSIFAYCGLRRNEGLWLRVEDIDVEARVINIVSRQEHKTKTAGCAIPVVFPEALLEPLTDWLAHRMDQPEGFGRPQSPYVFPCIRTSTPWTNGALGLKPLDQFKKAARRAGVTEGVTFHALRRSLATHYELHGAGGAMIQRLLRHSSQSVTQAFYQQADIQNMRTAVQAFSYA